MAGDHREVPAWSRGRGERESYALVGSALELAVAQRAGKDANPALILVGTSGGTCRAVRASQTRLPVRRPTAFDHRHHDAFISPSPTGEGRGGG